jgi:hypothetical protein
MKPKHYIISGLIALGVLIASHMLLSSNSPAATIGEGCMIIVLLGLATLVAVSPDKGAK